MAVTRSQNNAKKGQNGAAQSTATAPANAAPANTAAARPAGARARRRNVPGIQQVAMIRPGVERQCDNRYVLDANNPQYCVCGAALPEGNICNARILNNPASLSSHLSSRHNAASPYCLGQAPEDWVCECKPGDPFRNYHSALGHARRVHNFRGSSERLRKLSDRTIRLRGDTVYLPGDDEDEEYGDSDIADECGEGMPALPKERDDDEDDGFGGGHNGGHGFGLGQAQAIQVN